MFCSRCGKTVNAEWGSCRHCGALIGQSRFEGVPYTSAQEWIFPGAESSFETRAYTRTTYTGGDYEEYYDDGEVDVRTSYRPVYDSHSVPEDVRDDLRAAIKPEDGEAYPEEELPEEEYAPEDVFSDAPADEPVDEPAEDVIPEDADAEDVIDGFDMSKIKARPIVAKQRAGLSSEVEEYVRKLEMETDVPVRRGKHMAADDPYVKEDEPGEDMPEPEQVEDEEEYEDEPRGFDKARILKIVIALVAVAALFVLGVTVGPKLIDKFRKEASAPIEGVTLDLYNNGLALLQSHTADEYVDGVTETFNNGGYVALLQRLENDKAEINALLPETPNVNDELYLKAIAAIQDDIGSAITLDTVDNASAGGATSSDSETRWSTIRDLITGFGQINSAQGLSEIVAGKRIIAEIATQTPAPQFTPEPEYPALAKGDVSEDVQKMQERLWELGFLDDDRDGKFGANTQTAVKLFQQTAGLNVTGVADNETQVLLYSDAAPLTAAAKITPVPVVTPEPEPTPEPVPGVVEDQPIPEEVESGETL